MKTSNVVFLSALLCCLLKREVLCNPNEMTAAVLLSFRYFYIYIYLVFRAIFSPHAAPIGNGEGGL